MLKKLFFFVAVVMFSSCFGPVLRTAGAADLSGTVIQTMNAGGYTYMLVENGSLKNWVAMPETKVAAGDHVTYLNGMEMTNFYSRTLKRTFDKIIFSTGLAGAKHAGVTGTAAKAATPHPASKTAAGAADSFAAAVADEQQASSESAPASAPQIGGTSGGSSGAVVPFASVKVAKASGKNGYTIGEIFDKAKDLNGKTVRLRGKVVKINANIMGKNWIHLQDGTGNPMKNTHDLVVTTTDTAKLDQVITIKGTVAANKDFGAGYKYGAIIEDATIMR